MRRQTTPERTCVGCRSKASTDELIRLAMVDSEVALEAGNGRGAWLCRATALACFEQAVTRRAFARAFKRQISDCAFDGVRAHLSVVHSGEDARLSDGPFPS